MPPKRPRTHVGAPFQDSRATYFSLDQRRKTKLKKLASGANALATAPHTFCRVRGLPERCLSSRPEAPCVGQLGQCRGPLSSSACSVVYAALCVCMCVCGKVDTAATVEGDESVRTRVNGHTPTLIRGGTRRTCRARL